MVNPLGVVHAREPEMPNQTASRAENMSRLIASKALFNEELQLNALEGSNRYCLASFQRVFPSGSALTRFQKLPVLDQSLVSDHEFLRVDSSLTYVQAVGDAYHDCLKHGSVERAGWPNRDAWRCDQTNFRWNAGTKKASEFSLLTTLSTG